MQITNDLQLASMCSRAFAYVIDDLLLTVIIIAIFWDTIVSVIMMHGSNDVFNENRFSYAFNILKVSLSYFFCLVLWSNCWKIVAKIRVIDVNHWGGVKFFSSFIKILVEFFSEMFFI